LLAVTVALFACETWTLKKTDKDMILAFEMHRHMIILQVRWTQKVTNVEIRKRLNAKEDLLHKVMKRKLELVVHIARMDNSRKIKSVVMVEDGDNRKGRTYWEWLDDIKERCQKDIHLLIRIAQERNKWRQVVKGSLDT